MLRFSRVFAGVFIWRIVATQRGAALLADSKVDPARANLFTLFAHKTLRMFDGRDCAEMFAHVGSSHLPIVARKSSGAGVSGGAGPARRGDLDRAPLDQPANRAA